MNESVTGTFEPFYIESVEHVSIMAHPKVLEPKTAQHRRAAKQLTNLLSWMDEHGVPHDNVQKTVIDPDAAKQLLYDIEDTSQLLIAAGGDGTIENVKQLLHGERSGLKLLPFGGGNINDLTHQTMPGRSFNKPAKVLLGSLAEVKPLIITSDETDTLTAFSYAEWGVGAVAAELFSSARYLPAAQSLPRVVRRPYEGYTLLSVVNGSAAFLLDDVAGERQCNDLVLCNGSRMAQVFKPKGGDLFKAEAVRAELSDSRLIRLARDGLRAMVRPNPMITPDKPYSFTISSLDSRPVPFQIGGEMHEGSKHTTYSANIADYGIQVLTSRKR